MRPTGAGDSEQGVHRPDLAGKFDQENNYCRDGFFALLFYGNLVAVLIIFIVGISRGIPEDAVTPDDHGWIHDFKWQDAIKLVYSTGIVGGVAVLFAFVLLYILRSFPKLFIWFSLLASFCAFLGLTIWSGALDNALGVISFGIMAAILIWFMVIIAPFVPFASILLKQTGTLVSLYPTTQLAAFLAAVVQLVWAVFWGFTFALVQLNFSRESSKWLTVLLIFSLYWTFQVIKNTMHTTFSGFFATWYFMSGAWGMPPHPTWASFKRATTTSFGSIALGSLIVAIIQTLRSIIRTGRGKGEGLLAAVADCMLSLLEFLATFFNRYAFIYIAVYGKTYFQAAKATGHLFAENGASASANSLFIIDKILLTGSMLGALTSALVAWLLAPLVMALTVSEFHALIIIAAVVGWIVTSITLELVGSGVATILVCFAEDSEVLRQGQPNLYDTLSETFGGRLLASPKPWYNAAQSPPKDLCGRH